MSPFTVAVILFLALLFGLLSTVPVFFDVPEQEGQNPPRKVETI